MKPPYKNRQTFVFKGVTWKFESFYGEWHPPKGGAYKKLPVIYSSQHEYWSVNSAHGKTPLEALKNWVKLTIEYHESRVLNFQMVVQTHKDTIKQLKAKSWQPKTGKK